MSQNKEHIDELLLKCGQRDQRAQLEIYERYYKAMYNTAFRIVKQTATAEDIIQEAFLKAFSKLGSFRGEVSFGAWLKRIVINDSIQEYKRQRKRNEVALDGQMYKVKDEDSVGLDHASTALKAQKVMQTMNTLKDNYRISLTLHLIEGYDYEEIGQIMDLSYANCRTTISRAKESLRKKLAMTA